MSSWLTLNMRDRYIMRRRRNVLAAATILLSSFIWRISGT